MANYLGKKPEQRKEGRSIVAYGPPFVGKTTSLADPDVRVLLADMDHNTSPLDTAENVDIFPIDSYEDYLVFRESVERGYFMMDKNGFFVLQGVQKIEMQEYDIIAFDSFTRFEELIKRYVRETFAPNRKRELAEKFGAQSDWQDLQDIEVQQVRDWQQLTRTKGFNVIWIGHDMTLFNDPNAESRPTHIQLALQGKYASSRIMGAVDAVVYFAKVSRPSKADPKVMELVRGMYTQQFGITQADMRLPVEKREKLQNFIPNPKWSKILPYLGYTKPEK
jgi:hypothetical protein